MLLVEIIPALYAFYTCRKWFICVSTVHSRWIKEPSPFQFYFCLGVMTLYPAIIKPFFKTVPSESDRVWAHVWESLYQVRVNHATLSRDKPWSGYDNLSVEDLPAIYHFQCKWLLAGGYDYSWFLRVIGCPHMFWEQSTEKNLLKSVETKPFMILKVSMKSLIIFSAEERKA